MHCAPVFCRPSTSGHIGPGANSYPAGLVVVILGGRGTSLLSSQERSKEALPAAIKAFGLLFIPGDTSPPDPLATGAFGPIQGALPPDPRIIISLPGVSVLGLRPKEL